MVHFWCEDAFSASLSGLKQATSFKVLFILLSLSNKFSLSPIPSCPFEESLPKPDTWESPPNEGELDLMDTDTKGM